LSKLAGMTVEGFTIFMLFKMLEDEEAGIRRGMTLEEYCESKARLIEQANEIVEKELL
jgi:hypothetical protein